MYILMHAAPAHDTTSASIPNARRRANHGMDKQVAYIKRKNTGASHLAPCHSVMNWWSGPTFSTHKFSLLGACRRLQALLGSLCRARVSHTIGKPPPCAGCIKVHATHSCPDLILIHRDIDLLIHLHCEHTLVAPPPHHYYIAHIIYQGFSSFQYHKPT